MNIISLEEKIGQIRQIEKHVNLPEIMKKYFGMAFKTNNRDFKCLHKEKTLSNTWIHH